MRVGKLYISGQQRPIHLDSNPRFDDPWGPENRLKAGKHDRTRHISIGGDGGLQFCGPRFELPDSIGRAHNAVLKPDGRFRRPEKHEPFFGVLKSLVIGKANPRLAEREQPPTWKFDVRRGHHHRRLHRRFPVLRWLDIGGFVQAGFAILEVGPWTIESHRDHRHTNALPVADWQEKILAALSERGAEGEEAITPFAIPPLFADPPAGFVHALGIRPGSLSVIREDDVMAKQYSRKRQKLD